MRTFAGAVGILVLSTLLLACSQEEEVAPSTAPSVTASPASGTPSPPPTSTPGSPSPSPILTPIPCPTGDCSRISMFMEGPAQANLGDTVSYRLDYEVRGVQATSIIVAFPNFISYVSSRLISGSGGVTSTPTSEDIALRWELEEGPGVLEVTLFIPADITATVFTVGANEPGTGTTQSNAVTTTISQP